MALRRAMKGDLFEARYLSRVEDHSSRPLAAASTSASATRPCDRQASTADSKFPLSTARATIGSSGDGWVTSGPEVLELRVELGDSGGGGWTGEPGSLTDCMTSGAQWRSPSERKVPLGPHPQAEAQWQTGSLGSHRGLGPMTPRLPAKSWRRWDLRVLGSPGAIAAGPESKAPAAASSPPRHALTLLPPPYVHRTQTNPQRPRQHADPPHAWPRPCRRVHR
mmetsp:Transcript_15311/g.41930  ORF Transcript_15311/g.41930 Transcript_15311/m.41930 type:complete len:222 (+) Transcript_15311:1861-2526(+)